MSVEISALGRRLALARAGAAVSARELSSLAGMSPSMVGHIESGRVQTVGSDHVVALARVLGVSIGWLAAGQGAEPSAEPMRCAIELARAAHATAALVPPVAPEAPTEEVA